jgi:hypothetical protein
MAHSLKVGNQLICELKDFTIPNEEEGSGTVTDIKDGNYIISFIGFSAELPIESIDSKLEIGQIVYYARKYD